jgi:hypothetical protein
MISARGHPEDEELHKPTMHQARFGEVDYRERRFLNNQVTSPDLKMVRQTPAIKSS